jgi:hypothetical protein
MGPNAATAAVSQNIRVEWVFSQNSYRREYGCLVKDQNPIRTMSNRNLGDEIQHKGGRSITPQILAFLNFFSNKTFLTLFEFAIAFSVPHLILKPWQSLRIFGFSHLHTWGYDQM